MKAAVPIIAALTLALASCGGDSEEEQAQAAVCDARADISKQVDQLKGMTPSTFSTDAVSQSLSAIGSDLTKIKNAQGDLSDERRQQVQSANQEFASQVRGIAQQVAATKSAAEAKTALTSALQQLGDAYEQTFAKVDCS
jgi:3-methyladenine DNA glycosylase/8-oxoguanine DNA glycosylase